MKLESTVWWRSNIPGKKLTQIVNRVFNGSVKKHETRRKQVSWWNWTGGREAGWISLNVLRPKYPQALTTLSLGVRMRFPFRQLKILLQGNGISTLSVSWEISWINRGAHSEIYRRNKHGRLASRWLWRGQKAKGARGDPADSSTASSFFPGLLRGL